MLKRSATGPRQEADAQVADVGAGELACRGYVKMTGSLLAAEGELGLPRRQSDNHLHQRQTGELVGASPMERTDSE